jgi:hypothetical protein
MERPSNPLLIAGAALSAAAALLHLACIVVGAQLYRFVGAGEGMARMADAGHWYPTVAATAIAFVLALWALYALSGARVIRRLPLVRAALCVITAVYLLRGLGFQALIPYFPGNSQRFWFVSSAICLGFGLVHLLGLRQAWPHLQPEPNKALQRTRSKQRASER